MSGANDMQTQPDTSTLAGPHNRTLVGLDAIRRRLGVLFAAASATLTLWARRARERNELCNMSAVERRDLSLSHCDVEREGSKWFWQA
jgi:uncharacterized protein YjiS (DUF1127 family)